MSTFQPSAGKFWQQVGFRMAHSFPSVKHAITAVGSIQAPLHFMPPGKVVETRQPENNPLSLTNLARGMHLAGRANPKDIPLEAILSSSLFFMASATWTDKVGMPAMHVGSGLQILDEYSKGAYQGFVSNKEEVETLFIPMFRRFVVAACAFSDGFPDQFAQDIPTNFKLDIDLDKANFVTDIESAFEMTGTLIKCVLRLREGVLMDNIFPRVARALDDFEEVLTKLYLQHLGDNTLHSNTGNTFDHDYRHLRMHLATIRIMFETIGSDDDLDYDKYRKEFLFILVESKKLLDEEEEASSSRNTSNLRTTHGMIPPLFFTATRCRDLTIRKQAVDLLHSTARAERGWTSCMATSLARFVNEQEHAEPAFNQPRLDSQISLPFTTPTSPTLFDTPFRRIRLQSVSFSSADRKAYITYFQCYPNSHSRRSSSASQLSQPSQPLSPPGLPHVQATIPYTPTATVERDGVTSNMADKVLHAFGYTGIVLYSPRIACHCASSALLTNELSDQASSS